MSIASQLSFGNAAVLSTGTLSGDRGVTAGSATTSFVEYNGTTATSGQFDGSSTAPSATTRLNYNGNLHATNFVGSLTGAATTSGTVTTAAQPNITSVGTLTSLAVTGNANVGNLNSSSRVIATDNMIVTSSGGEGGQIILSFVGISGITGQANSTWNMDVDASNNFRLFYQNATGTTGVALTANSSSNVITTLGNVSAPFFIGNGSQLTGIVAAAGAAIVNGNSNVTVTANSNVTVFVAGNTTARWTATSTGIVANGTYSISGNANIGNLGTAQVLATANVTAPQLISNIATGTAPFIVTSTTQVANLSVATAGTATSATSATNAAALLQNTSSATTVYPTFSTSGSNGNSSAVISTGISANLGNNAITATTFVGAFNGNGNALTSIPGGNVTGTVANATTATQANTVRSNATTTNPVYLVGSTADSNGYSGLEKVNSIYANLGNGSITATTFVGNHSGNGNALTSIPGGNVTGTVANATTATQANTVRSNATTTNPVYLVGSSIDSNANTVLEKVNSIYANLGNGSITATTFVGNHSGNGSGLSSIAGANVTGTVANATTATQANTVRSNVTTTVPVYLVGSSIDSNANTVLEKATSIYANLGNGSIIATTFVGALSGAATTAGTVTTAAQPNITSVGTLTSVAVTGNANVGNLNATTAVVAGTLTSNIATGTAPLTVTSTTRVSNLNVAYANVADFITVAAGTGNNFLIFANAATGNITEVTSTGLIANLSNNSITATTFVGALSGAATSATTAGTVTTAAQPNITSTGTLTSLTVTGNVAAGNLTTTGVLSVTGTGVSSIGGNLDMTSNTIINLATPTNSTDAATKQYVDDVAQGLHTHDSCNAATQTTLASISGGTITYNNGTSGVGATLTTTGSYTTIDGVTLSNGMRILVKSEANTAHNGIYDRTSTTVLTRSDDFNTPTEMAGGDFTFVTAGTLYDNTGWVMPDPVTTVGTSAVVWVQFSGAGTYTAGTGLTLTGSQFSVNASQTQVTAVGTLTGLNSSGTVTAPAFTANTGIFTGNGSGLSAIAGANVTGTVSSATSATTAGTVTTAAQPNITSVGTLTSLGVNGTITGTRLISNIATGTAPLTVTSTTRVANLNVDYANVADFISVAAGTGNNFLIFANAATGNITELTSTGLIANLSNNSITATTFVGALSGAATSATTAGTVTTAAQPNITSVGTLTSLGVNGTVTAVNFTANTGVFAGSGANLTTLNASNISSGTLAQARLANASVTLGSTALTLGSTVTTVAGLSSVTSTTFVGALTGAATTAGTVTTAAQPNITSVGTLTSLNVSGNINVDSGTFFVDSTTNSVTVKSNVAYVSPNGANTITNQMLNGGTLAWTGNAGQLFSITDSMTGNIFTVNDVSGIPMISVDAGGNIQFAASGGFVEYGVTTGITAAGSAQGTATTLTRPINVISTVSSGANGIILPTVPAGARIVIVNTSANALNVYPPSGAVVNSAATNAAYSQPAGARLEYISTSTTQWYTLNATYG